MLNELTIESNEYPVERYKITSLDGNIVAGNPIFQKKFQCKLNGFRSGLYIIHLVINGSSYKKNNYNQLKILINTNRALTSVKQHYIL